MRYIGMRTVMLSACCAVALLIAPSSRAGAQVAGGATLGVTIEELKVVVVGWSAKHKLMDAAIYNDKNEKIGKIEDIIVSPARTVSHAIIGVGGFLGVVGKHQVAIPMDQIKFTSNRFILAGASKDALKKMPEFHYAP